MALICTIVVLYYAAWAPLYYEVFCGYYLLSLDGEVFISSFVNSRYNCVKLMILHNKGWVGSVMTHKITFEFCNFNAIGQVVTKQT